MDQKHLWGMGYLDKFIEKYGRIVFILFMFIIFSFLSNKNLDIPFVKDYCNLTLKLFNIPLVKDYCNLILKLLLSVMLLLFFRKWHREKNPEKSISNVIRDIITGKIEELYGIIGILFLLSMVSWFGDSIYNIGGWSDLSGISHSIIAIINIFSFGYLYLTIYPEVKHPVGNIPERREVLIMALSKLSTRGEEELEKLKTAICEDKLEEKYTGVNWQLPLRTLRYHIETLKMAYFLVSKESDADWELFQEFLKDMGDKHGTNLTSIVNKSKPVDFNNQREVMDELKTILRQIKRNEYRDDQISINISGGTSAVTLCLTILGIEDERQIEYFTQEREKSKLVRFDLSKDDAIAFLKTYTI